jgi:hypothetical protein
MSDLSAFKLPEIDPAARPEFTDGASCKAWLENVPLANVSTAQRQLLIQIEELNRHAAPARARLEALEAAREAVNFVQIEQAKRFTHRALPMLPGETAIFEDTLDLWEQMRLGYLRCLQEGGAVLRPQAALLCQRALSFSGLRMYHHYRAYRLVPGRDWRALHGVYARAEALGVADKAVKDYLNRDVYDTSARTAYLRALLMGACNPNELGPRQLSFVAYLLERWGEKVESRRCRPRGERTCRSPSTSRASVGQRGDPQGAGQCASSTCGAWRRACATAWRCSGRGESPARLALGEARAASCRAAAGVSLPPVVPAAPARSVEHARHRRGAGLHRHRRDPLLRPGTRVPRRQRLQGALGPAARRDRDLRAHPRAR